MSDRERWIVYPLLFLALGVSLRDKITRSISDIDTIAGIEALQCRRLAIVDAEGRTLMRLGAARYQRDGAAHQFGAVDIYSSEGRKFAQLGPVMRCKALAVDDDDGKPLAVVGTVDFLRGDQPDHAGLIKTFGSDGTPHAQLGPVVECRQLHIVGQQSQSRVVSLASQLLSAEGQTPTERGVMTVNTPEGQPLVIIGAVDSGQSGFLTTQHANGKSQVLVRSALTGGAVSMFDGTSDLQLGFGHRPAASGIWAESRQANQTQWLLPLKRAEEPGNRPTRDDQPPRQKSKPAEDSPRDQAKPTP